MLWHVLDALPQPYRLLHEILQEEVLDRVYIAIDAMELSSTFRKERPVKPLVPSCDLAFGLDVPMVTALTLTGEGRSFAVGMADGTVVLNSIDGIDACASAPARVFAAGIPIAAVEAGSWAVEEGRAKVALLAVRGVPPLAPKAASEAVTEGEEEAPVEVSADAEVEVDPAVAAADAALARRSVVVLRGSIDASGANVLTALATIETSSPPSVVRISADSAFIAVYSAKSRALRLYSVPSPEDDPEDAAAAAEGESEESESAAGEGPAVDEASEGDAEAAGGDAAEEATTIAPPIAPPLPVLRALLSIAAPSAFPSAAPWPTFTASEGVATKLVVRWGAKDALVSRQIAQYALPQRPAVRGARALFDASADAAAGADADASGAPEAEEEEAVGTGGAGGVAWEAESEWRVPAPITASAVDDVSGTTDLLCIGMGRAVDASAGGSFADTSCGTIVWSLRTGVAVACLRKQRAPVSSVAFAGGGERSGASRAESAPTRIVVCASDATVHVYVPQHTISPPALTLPVPRGYRLCLCQGGARTSFLPPSSTSRTPPHIHYHHTHHTHTRAARSQQVLPPNTPRRDGRLLDERRGSSGDPTTLVHQGCCRGAWNHLDDAFRISPSLCQRGQRAAPSALLRWARRARARARGAKCERGERARRNAE